MRCSAAITITAVVSLALIAGLLVAADVTGGVVAGKEQVTHCPPNERDLLIRPEDVAVFGDVIVTTPEHPLEEGHTQLQGWEDAREIAIALSSPKPGEYVADIISHLYKFSSPQNAQAALAGLPHAREAGIWLDGTSLLDDELAGLLDACSVTWDVVYAINDTGLPTYGFSLQIGSYVADVYITTFSVNFADELTSEASASDEEKGREYVEVITRKLGEGKTFEQLVDTERAHSFGQRLLNHVLKRMIDEDRGE